MSEWTTSSHNRAFFPIPNQIISFASLCFPHKPSFPLTRSIQLVIRSLYFSQSHYNHQQRQDRDEIIFCLCHNPFSCFNNRHLFFIPVFRLPVYIIPVRYTRVSREAAVEPFRKIESNQQHQNITAYGSSLQAVLRATANPSHKMLLSAARSWPGYNNKYELYEIQMRTRI